MMLDTKAFWAARAVLQQEEAISVEEWEELNSLVYRIAEWYQEHEFSQKDATDSLTDTFADTWEMIHE